MSVKYVMTTRGMESLFMLALRPDVELPAPVHPTFRSGSAGPDEADLRKEFDEGEALLRRCIALAPESSQTLEMFAAARFLISSSRRWLAHGLALSARAASVVSAWMERDRQRRELSRMSARDLQDIGLTPGDVHREGSLCFWMRSAMDQTKAVRARSTAAPALRLAERALAGSAD